MAEIYSKSYWESSKGPYQIKNGKDLRLKVADLVLLGLFTNTDHINCTASIPRIYCSTLFSRPFKGKKQQYKANEKFYNVFKTFTHTIFFTSKSNTIKA